MNDKGRLRWHCRRGMKELDVLLEGYLANRYDAAPQRERDVFAELLMLPDPQLLDYVTGREEPGDAATIDVVAQLRTSRRA
ncbi:MAG TPA: succinate dehydrogenase assembly factor 2 [Gammaproteobacteria bacterium]|nr:succinate dehydrogenase assembly factor 2 [Gammaproteobacteria bacterium]